MNLSKRHSDHNEKLPDFPSEAWTGLENQKGTIFDVNKGQAHKQKKVPDPLPNNNTNQIIKLFGVFLICASVYAIRICFCLEIRNSQ